jgi:glyoxylase-like metal-dependent hydrolase (beta-lactamase superfamily II)
MKPAVKAFFDEETYTVTYVVMDPSSHHCAIIDPVLDFDQPSCRTSTGSADQVLDFIQDNNLEVAWILETHAHADHLSAAAYLKSKTKGKTATGRLITGVQATFKNVFKLGDEFVANGEQFDRGSARQTCTKTEERCSWLGWIHNHCAGSLTPYWTFQATASLILMSSLHAVSPESVLKLYLN